MPFFLLILLSGCSAHIQGLVEKRPLGVWMQTSEGKNYQLLTDPSVSELAYLEGLIITVDGRRVFRKITVTDYTVREGLHGLQSWVGVLEKRGIQIGLQDRNSGSFFFVTRDSVSTLEPFVGKPVLLEGYVEGAHEVTVMYYRPLFREGGESDD